MSRRKARRSRTEAFVPFAVHVPKDRCEETGKIRFTDPVDAWLAVVNIQGVDAPHRFKQERRPYRCLFCGDLHLTSQEQRTEVR